MVRKEDKNSFEGKHKQLGRRTGAIRKDEKSGEKGEQEREKGEQGQSERRTISVRKEDKSWQEEKYKQYRRTTRAVRKEGEQNWSRRRTRVGCMDPNIGWSCHGFR